MVFCLYDCPTNVSALQFEWAWQHPMESLAVRQTAATFKTFSGVVNKIKLAYTMLNLASWKSVNITANYFSAMNMKHHVACSSLPEHMKKPNPKSERRNLRNKQCCPMRLYRTALSPPMKSKSTNRSTRKKTRWSSKPSDAPMTTTMTLPVMRRHR